jgi:predicted amidophosphoribosyltransferase
MNVNVRQIQGPWNLGFSLDKHTLNSTYLGDDEHGHARFNTTRSEIGEALYQLKYKSDQSQIAALAAQMAASLGNHFASTSFVVPMPPSKHRAIQPLAEIAKQVASIMGVPCLENVLVKTTQTAQMKDIPTREDRITALCSAFVVNDVLADGQYDVLVIDDLYDTGSSLEAATIMLRQYRKIRNIFVATLTRKNP